MASNDNQEGSRSVLWPPPPSDRKQDWQQQHQHYGQPYGQQPSPRMKLTPEEMAVLKGCSRDSFWYRCAPLAVVSIATVQTLVNRGVLKGHPRYGALFKNMAAGMMAYFVGKLSYQGECRRQIMMLENSPLADAMRKGKRGRDLFQEMAIPTPSGGGDMQTGAPGTDMFDPKSRDAVSHMDMDTDSRKVTELDDGLRPTLDSAEKKNRQDSRGQSTTNYADLRAQNRMDYERKGNSPAPSQPRPSPSFGDRPIPPPPPSSDMYSEDTSKRRNKYGDVIE